MRKLALIAILLSAFAAPSATAQDTSPLALQQGTWKVLSFNREGTPTPDEIAHSIRRVVQGDRVTWQRDGKTFAATTLRLDPAASPPALDVIPEGGPNRGQPVLGIYRQDHDQLTICMADPGKPRPTSFEPPAPGSGLTLMSFTRQPADDKPPSSP